MADLIRSKPGQLQLRNRRHRTANHMMGVVYLAQAGLPPGAATAVPYRGEGPPFRGSNRWARAVYDCER
jgi:hypothetical protein